MGFKLLYTNLAGPQGDFLVNPSDTFEAGQIGYLLGTMTGSPQGLPQVNVSDGTIATLVGIIDDNKNTQFLATVQNESVVTGTTVAFAHANIISGTLTVTGTSPAAALSNVNYVNGTADVGTAGVVSYSYIIPGKAGDDTTLASGKCTLWLQSGEYSTDVYEVASSAGVLYAYAVGTALYASANGKLTETQVGSGALVGYVTKSPSAGNTYLNFYKV